jgi:hypothetical protein
MTRLGVSCALAAMLLTGTSLEAARPPASPAGTTGSVSPELDRAATALADGKLDTARNGFENVAKDAMMAPFARSLATLGLAETAIARKDPGGAFAAWRQLEADATTPQHFRDIARRRISEQERARKGLTSRDPAAYRAQLPPLPEPAVTLHVAPEGADSADGTEARPFATLEKAQDAIRAIKKTHEGTLPRGGARVVIHGGVYPAKQPFALAAEDSGSPGSPVVYQARAGASPVFDGGITVTGWRPISDAGVLAKLDPAVREHVLEADLKALGVADLGDPTALRRRPEFYCDGTPQTLARWPNEGFVKTGKVLGTETFKVYNTILGCRDGKFEFTEDRPARWVDEPDVRLYGYWFWDWSDDFQKVASIDPAAHTIILDRPYSSYGYRKGQRYHAVNVLRELDAPGEWYVDRGRGVIDWLPPEGVDASRSVTTFSVYSQPFVSLDDVRDVVLMGLVFQNARSDGIHMRGGADCLIAGCTLQRLGGDAIVVAGGRHHGLFGCTMRTLGCGGMRVSGGDRRTLTPGGHYVENCSVSDISRAKRTYTPAVLLDGCGNRIAHNRFERIPSSAMRIEGNDHLIELNEIRHVVEESDDQGGIDMFGNPLYRGVVIRWNRWSDIRGGTECGAAGIRLDDMISGVTIYGNLFERCGAVLFGGVQVHGGKDNLIDGNAFLDCYAGVSFSRWAESRWLEALGRFKRDAGSPTYASRYPDLGRLEVDPNVNVLSRNIFAACKSPFLRDGGIERCSLNTVIPQAIDLNGPQARRVLFEEIPVGEIGPYAHPWVASPVK